MNEAVTFREFKNMVKSESDCPWESLDSYDQAALINQLADGMRMDELISRRTQIAAGNWAERITDDTKGEE